VDAHTGISPDAGICDAQLPRRPPARRRSAFARKLYRPHGMADLDVACGGLRRLVRLAAVEPEAWSLGDHGADDSVAGAVDVGATRVAARPSDAIFVAEQGAGLRAVCRVVPLHALPRHPS